MILLTRVNSYLNIILTVKKKTMNNNVIIYEQPLNELIRVCLRLEQLFSHLDHHIGDTTTLGTRNTIVSIIQLLNLLDRPDLKAKLAKELNYHLSALGRLENTPEIDQLKLNQLLEQLESLSHSLIDSNGKIAQNLREIELLNTLRLHLSSPGGACSFDTPIYHFWLQQPAKERQEMIMSWLKEFNNVRLATSILLQLIREGTKNQSKTAENGFYQELLDPQINLRLVRVTVPNDINAYPEISIGRHFVSVRFFVPTIHQRPAQYHNTLSFWLSYCIT